MILKNFLKLIHSNVKIHIFYDNNDWIFCDTAENIKRTYAYYWNLQYLEVIDIDVKKNTIWLTLKEE